MKTQSRDTCLQTEGVRIQLLRNAPPWRKLAMIEDTNRAMRTLALAGLRLRHPEESSAALRRRLADMMLGPELAQRAYGTFPDTTRELP
jgi:hypothetical protein